MHFRRPVPFSIGSVICLVLLCIGGPASGHDGRRPAPTRFAGERDTVSGSFALDGLSFTVFHGARLAADEPKESEKPENDKPPSDKAFPMKEHDEVRLLKQRIIELQNSGKLGFRKIVPCSSVEGYGMYSPMEPGGNVPNLMLYVEPSNYSTMVTQDRYIVDCSVDLILTDLTGKVLGEKKGILRINRVSRSPILDLFYRIQIGAKKPPKQGFIVKTVLHDKIKNQSAGTSFRINIQPGGKSGLDPI